MWIHQWALVLLLAVSFCHAASDKNVDVEVVGFGECSDCAQSNIKTSQAFAGLGVTVDCKIANGAFKTRGVGQLDEEGKFSISLDKELVKDGELSEECYAQLHSVSNTACPTLSGMESAKLILKEKIDGKHKFGIVGKIKFSPVTCTSAVLWHHYKYPPLPPLSPYHHPWLKHLPPPVPIYKKPYLPPVPVYTKPLLPPVPVYTKPLLPPVPVYTKPLPPPVPIYKPAPKPKIKKPCPPIYKKPSPIYKKPSPIHKPAPVYKPKPTPTPAYKPTPVYKPKPTPTPTYKPTPTPTPTYKPTPTPKVYKHHPYPKITLPPSIPVYMKPLPPLPPLYKKPLPPFPKFPPFTKKPCPPLPKLPPFPKLPPHKHHFSYPLPPFAPSHP